MNGGVKSRGGGGVKSRTPDTLFAAWAVNIKMHIGVVDFLKYCHNFKDVNINLRSSLMFEMYCLSLLTLDWVPKDQFEAELNDDETKSDK